MPHKFISILLLALALCACKGKPVSNAAIERYKLEGEIVALDPERQVAKINAREIKGWMEAMTMEYQVKDRSGFATLHIGDRITATVFVQDLNFWIGEIHQVL
jgi:Cu/Ag efflux protein CusF